MTTQTKEITKLDQSIKPEVLNPLVKIVGDKIVELKKLKIKDAKKMTEADFEKYKKARTGANSVLKQVHDKRTFYTSQIMDFKELFMQREKDIIKNLKPIELALTKSIQGKQALIQLERNRASMPERMARLETDSIPYEKSEIEQMGDKQFEAFIQAKLQARADIDSDKKLKKRLKEIGYDEQAGDIIQNGKVYQVKGVI